MARVPRDPAPLQHRTRAHRGFECGPGLRAAACVMLVAFAGCARRSGNQSALDGNDAATPPAQPVVAAKYTYHIVNTWPHDRQAFTQGLVFIDGRLFESTGLNGESSLREVDLATGRVRRRVDVPAQYFAEGLAILGGQAFQLTWQNQRAFVYDRETFRLEKEFSYTGEGWGLTTDGRWLVMSDGSSQIRFLDPATFAVMRSIVVTHGGLPVPRLNELEWINGEIFANVWQSDLVVRIDPRSGNVTGVIDFTGLLPPQDRDASTDVLNGIAYDAARDRLFVTGKRWPKLFEVRLQRVP